MTERDKTRTMELASWLGERRWYGDKARALTGADVEFHLEAGVDREPLALDVARLTYDAGEPASYLLFRTEDHPDVDGIESDAVRAWLLNGFAESRALSGDGGRLRWRPLPGEPVDWPGLAGASRVFRGEQSNTSVVYGDRAILKVFRKLREGTNPEVEVGEFLTEHTAFTAFPRLLGVIELESRGVVTTIAAAQAFIPSVSDAWSWLTARLGDAEIRPATIAAARLLGTRTGEMHIAFASGASSAFAPEEATDHYAESMRSDAVRELDVTVAQLERAGVDEAAALGAGLMPALDALRAIEGTMVTRIHGDYHLGQVLRTARDDFAILDFEGEPTRPLAERRAKASPLRDVAGMLRSFDYAAETARRATPGEARDIDVWYLAAREAFLEGYDEVVRNDAVMMHGWTPEGRSAALAALELHKALYEVRYELSNRPDWLAIPLNALRRLATPASG
jgi:trehalose synthase-fused probable maltokinase